MIEVEAYKVLMFFVLGMYGAWHLAERISNRLCKLIRRFIIK